MTMSIPDLPPAASLSRAEQRRLLASTPPPTQWLTAHPFEDLVVRTLMRTPPLRLGRLGAPGRRSSDLLVERLGAARIFDRGLIQLLDYDETHMAWTWTNLTAHTDATRMLRHRTLGFLPYNLGHIELTPATMSGPELVAMLVWHYRHSTVRHLMLDLAGDRVTFVEQHADGTTTVRPFKVVPNVSHYREQTSNINPHRDDPERVWEAATLKAFLTNLVTRIAPAEFGEPRMTVNLINWRLNPHAYTPVTFTEALPLDVQDALSTLSAPTFGTAEDFVAWTETNLTITVTCTVGDLKGAQRRGGRRHTLRLDPHTHVPSTVSSANPAQVEALAAMHLLHAFGVQPEPRCVVAGRAWATDGFVKQDQQSWTPTSVDRVAAIHRVAYAVQHLDAGLDFDLISPTAGLGVTRLGPRAEALRAAMPKVSSL